MRSIALSRPAVWLALVVAVAIAGVFLYERSRPAAAEVASKVAVVRGSIAATTTATGNVAARQARLSFGTSGVLREMLVKVGDHLEAGQPLARLDSQDLELQVEHAKAQLAIAQAKLQQLTEGASPVDVAAAQAAYDAAVERYNELTAGPTQSDILSAQAALASAQAAERDANGRFKTLTDGALQADRASAAAAVTQARGTLDAAQAKLAQLQSGPTSDEIQRNSARLDDANAQLRAAEAKLAQAEAGPTNADLTAAEAAATKAQADFTGAQARLDQTRAVSAMPAAVATAQSNLATAAANLQTAHQQLDTISDQLAMQKNTRLALESELSDLSKSADDICGKLGSRSGDCQAANAKVEELRPQIIQVDQQINLLAPHGWDALAARAQVLAAQSAYDAAATTLQQVEAAREVPVDLITAQTTVDAAVSALTSANARLDQVKAGASNADLVADRSAADQAKAAVSSAQAALNSTLAGATDADLVAAQTAVVTAEANLDAAQSKLDTLGQATPQSVEAARAAQASTMAGAEAAQAKLDLLLSGPTQADVDTGSSAVAQAQATLSQRATGGARRSDVSLQREAEHAAEIDLRIAQRALDNATLSAPFAGVVQSISTNSSEAIISGTPVVTLLDPRDIRVEATVDGADIGQVAVGQTAEISLDDHPSQIFAGRVVSVAAGGELVQGVVSFPITVSVNTPNAALVPGLPAHAMITGLQKDDVLLLPAQAVRRDGRDSVVDVLNADTTKPRTVHVGMNDGNFVEILDGVSQGDVVVLPR